MEWETDPHSAKLNCVSNGKEIDTLSKKPAECYFFGKVKSYETSISLWQNLVTLYMPHNISKKSTDALELWLAHVHRPPSVAHGQILPVRATVSLSP